MIFVGSLGCIVLLYTQKMKTIDLKDGATNDPIGTWSLVDIKNADEWNRVVGSRRFQVAAPAPTDSNVALCVASRKATTSTITWNTPECEAQYTAVDVYAAATTAASITISNGDTSRECMRGNTTPNFTNGVFDTFAIKCGSTLSITIDPRGGAVVACFSNARVFESQKASPSEYKISVASRLVSVKPPQTNFTEKVTLEISDGVTSVVEDAFWSSGAFRARIPASVGWTLRKPEPNRVTSVRAFVDGVPCDEGRIVTADVERSPVIARFEPTQLNTVENAKIAIRNMVREKAVWMFGSYIGRRWAKVAKVSPLAAQLPAFEIASDRDLDTPFIPCAAVFCDSAEAGIASLTWSSETSSELKLPRRKDIEGDNKLYIALNAFGKSISPWSNAVVRLSNSLNDDEMHSFSIIAANQDLTSGNPRSLAFDITHLCGDETKNYDVALIVNKQRETRDASIVVCVSSLRVVEASPVSPLESKPFIGTITSTSELFYCVDARRVDGTPSNAIGEALIARVSSERGKPLVELPLHFDAFNTSPTKTVFTLPTKFIRDALGTSSLTPEAAATNGVFFVEAFTPENEKVAETHPIVYDTITQKVLYADTAVVNAMKQGDQALATRYAKFSSAYDVKWGRVVPKVVAHKSRNALYIIACVILVATIIATLYTLWRLGFWTLSSFVNVVSTLI